MKEKKILLIVFCVLLPIFLLLFSYKSILIFVDYNTEQQKVIDFLEGKEKLEADITALEIDHLNDVKEVMKNLDLVFYFLLLVLTLIITYTYKNKPFLKKLFFYGGITTLSFIFLFFILTLTNFNFIFTTFHQIFFPQGNWIFPTDSLLIQTFPLEFFVRISTKIFLLTIVFGIGFMLVNLALKKLWG